MSLAKPDLFTTVLPVFFNTPEKDREGLVNFVMY